MGHGILCYSAGIANKVREKNNRFTAAKRTPISGRQFCEKVPYCRIVVNEFNSLHTGGGQFLHDLFLFGSQLFGDIHGNGDIQIAP